MKWYTCTSIRNPDVFHIFLAKTYWHLAGLQHINYMEKLFTHEANKNDLKMSVLKYVFFKLIYMWSIFVVFILIQMPLI